MAKTTLRGYTREIDGLIDRGQYEQALAHCRYLLKFFPKHADIYRLMAKAYLESQRYGDAADVFQRVLSSIPDDFVSQLGMSIIREDEGNLDAAIWHMERAFEIQPANVAIQSELRRLYGRRDGMEPPKIRLTRGALARMYFKGELYQQAIAELRTALAADPQRPDLQLLLAQSYARAGQKVDAVNTCTALLKKLPYCIEANRILADILGTTDKADEAQKYRQRAISLNPYLGQTNPKAPTPDLVPDEAIVVEKLDWTPDAGVSSQPQWAASLGLNLAQPAAQPEDIPDWLTELETNPPLPAGSPGEFTPKVSPFVSTDDSLADLLGDENVGMIPQTPSSDELIPDWMKDAGWVPSSGDTSAAERGYTIEDEVEEVEGDELAPAEIPGWLRAIAPQQFPGEEPIDQEELGEIDDKLIEALDWPRYPGYKKHLRGPSDTVATWLEGIEQPTPELAPTDELPDWLAGAGLAAGAAMIAGKDEPPQEDAGIESPLQTGEPIEPIFATEPEFEMAEDFFPQAEGSAEDEVPDWLADLSPVEQEAGAVSEFSTPPAQAETPDWLTALEQEPEIIGEEVAPADLPEAELESELPEWLAAAPVAEEVEPLLGEELPDWMSETPQSGDEILKHEVEEEELPDWMGTAAAEQVSAEELPDWLRELQPEEPAQPELSQEPEAEMPEWLVGLAAGAGAAAVASELRDEALIEQDGELTEETTEAEALLAENLEPQAEITQDEEDAAFAWLEGLAAKQGASEALFLTPEERLEEPPEWVLKEAALGTAGDLVASEAADEHTEPEELPSLEEEPYAEVSDVEMEWVPEDFAAEEALQAALDEALREGLEAPDLAEVTPEEFLPTWLRKAGPESVVSQTEEEAQETVDITSWLSQMEDAEAASEEPGGDAWLVDEAAQAEEAVIHWLPDIEPTGVAQPEDEALAEWLAQQPQAANEIDFEFPQTDQWLEEALEDELTGQEQPLEGIGETQPAWLADLKESEEAVEEITASTLASDAEELPEWMAGAAALAALAGSEETQQEEQRSEEDMLPAWLESLDFATEASLESGETATLEIEEPEVIEGDTQPASIAKTPDADLTPEAAAEQPLEAASDLTSQVEAREEQAKPAEALEGISDEDAAFAWLESLAVKQGATEALLLTPEERLEEPPAWVKQASQQAEEEIPPAEIPQAESVKELPVEPETDRTTEVVDEDLPEWLIGAAAGAVAAAGTSLASEEEPAERDAQLEVTGSAPEAESPLESPPTVEGEIESAYAWLESLATLQDSGEGKAESTVEGIEEAPELPEWLADLEPEAVETESVETAWTPEMAGITPEVEPEPLENLVPLVDLNQAALIQIERLPGVGFRRAQALVEYRQEHGPLSSLNELVNVEGFDAELVESLAGHAQVLAPISSQPTQAETVGASLPVSEDSTPTEAVAVSLKAEDYQVLIQQGEKIPQVVNDIQEALRLRPQDISLWMALGDAQMRQGLVQEALESYNKAEELL